MGLWADTLAYQLSPATGLSGLTQKKDDAPDGRGFEARDVGSLPVVALLEDCEDDEAFISNIARRLEYVRNSNISTWLKDHPDWADPDAAVSPRASKSPHAAACAQSVASVQDATVAMSSTSPDGRVARHKIWGAVLDTSGAAPRIVLPAVLPDFEDILRASGSKNDRARMFAESLSDFYEEVAQNTRDFLFKLTFPPHIGNLFCNLLLEMCLKKTPMSEDKAFLDKEVSVLNLLPPNLALEETTARVSAEKTASIEDMLDIPSSKQSKASTSINTSGLCQTKENVLECIANWLLLMNHNYTIDNAAPPLLYGAFFKLADLIAEKDYKNWYGRSIQKAPWIPLQHIDQLQRIMSGLSKLANTPALIRQVMAGQPLDPAPFVCISNAASDLIRDIEVCTQLGSLGQIFASPSVLYLTPAPKPTPTPTTTPDKHPRPSLTQNDDPELARKRRKSEKEGWLKKLSRGIF